MNNSYDYGNTGASNSNFLIGFICGAALGAIAALLLAPRRGDEMRGIVSDSMNRAGQRARDTYNMASERVSDLAGLANDAAQHLSQRAAELTAKLNRNMASQSASSAPSSPTSLS